MTTNMTSPALPVAGNTSTGLQRQVCPGCPCFGRELHSFELKRLPGFAMFTCQECHRLWIVCTKCTRTSLRFTMLVQEADNTLVFERKSSFINHLTSHTGRRNHADIVRPFPSSIPLPQVSGCSGSHDGPGNEKYCTTISTFLPPPNKRPRLWGRETTEPSSCLRNFTEEATLLSQQQFCEQTGEQLSKSNNSCRPLQILSDHQIENHPDVCSFSRFQTKEFLLYSRSHQALQVAVCKAFFKEEWKNKHVIQKTDIIQFLHLVRLIHGLTQNYMKMSLVPMLCKGEKFAETLPPFKEFNDFRSRVFEGPHAFLNNLPLVMPEKVDDDGGLAYVSVIESIALILYTQSCQNLDIIKPCPENTDTVTRLSQSKYAQQLFDPDADKHLLMVAWQDAFSGNRSQTNKSERFSVWAKSATLVPAERQRGGTLYSERKNTVLVALTLDNADKTVVEQRFFSELKILDTKGGIQFYDASLGKTISVRITPLAFKGDQPERRKMIGWARTGSSNFGKQMGVVGDWNAIYMHVSSCDKCLRANLYEKRVIEDCPECLNWDVLRDSPLSAFKKPKYYPQSEDTGKEELRFQEQSFEKMIEAADKTYLMVYNKDWNKGVAACYLNTQGFSKKVYEKIIQNASNMSTFDHLDQLPEATQQLWRRYQADCPDHFVEYPLPPILSSGFKIEQIVPLLMHLLFLGIVKSVLGTMLTWLKKEKMAAPFQRFSKGILESIASLNVEWCRPQPYDNGECGKWVSENHMAIARLLPWFYQSLTEIHERDEEELPPYNKNNVRCWTVGQCRDWLARVGITATEGAGKDVQKQVQDLMKDPGGPPTRVYDKPSPTKAQMLVQSVTAMVSRLMAKSASEESIQEVHRHVLIFLSYYHRFDDEMKTGLREMKATKHKPTWLGTNNFVDLPRLKYYMQLFGPLTNLWEGDSSGEKFVQLPKRQGKLRGNRKNWAMNCAERIQKCTSLDAIDQMPEIEILTDGEPAENMTSGKHQYRPYKMLSEIEQSIRENKPLSGFVTNDNGFGLCVQQKRQGRAPSRKNYFVMKQVKFEFAKCGLAYHKWELDTNQGEKPLDDESVARYLLFLPILGEDGFMGHEENNGLLTVISHDWKILDRDLNFKYLEVDHWIDAGAE